MKEIPILDNFYNDVPYLTPDKFLGELGEKIKKIVEDYNINTAIISWSDSEKFSALLTKCEFLGKDKNQQAWVWDKKILIEIITIGAPMAVRTVEYFNCYGIKNLVAFGPAGCIDENFDAKKILVVEKAIRDEGSSYQYLPADLYAKTNKTLTRQLNKFLNSKNIPNTQGITWTTDAFFRETSKRIAKRISQGAVSVEMECSALAAACEFHKMRFCQFLFFSDLVKNGKWDWVDPMETKQENWDKRLPS